MHQLIIQKLWLRGCVFLLSIYYISVYLDPNLMEYICNCGIWGFDWPSETESFIFKGAADFFTRTHVYVLIFIGVASSLLLNLKRFTTAAVLTTLTIQAIILFRNPSFYVIHRPYIGLLTSFLPFILYNQNRTYFKFCAIDWLWSASAISYLASAISKIADPYWLSGTALSQFIGFPLKSKLFLWIIESSFATSLMTYTVIFIELFYGLFGYFQRWRFFCWVMILLLHIGILVFIQIYTATLPMILFHLFLFDVKWIVFLRKGTKNATS